LNPQRSRAARRSSSPAWKKAGPVLFQLPPQFKKDRQRLTSFVKLLSSQWQYAFEFRHRSWYDDDIFDLRREKVLLCAFLTIVKRQHRGL
jgi:uncharacterized protein YecE (DUF72 family)